MRLVVWSVLALVLAAGSAGAQDRMRRGDDPVLPAAKGAKPTNAKQQIRAIRRPFATPAPEAIAAAATARRDTADCLQEADSARQIAGCTHLIEDEKQADRVKAAARYNRGNALAAKGDYDGAIADYDAAIKLEPKNARAYNNRGTVYRDKGDAEKAFSDFTQAAQLNPRDADAQYNLGNAHAAKGETAEAIKAYGAAIKADWRNANAYVARAIAQLYAGAPAKAQMDLLLAQLLAAPPPKAQMDLLLAQRVAPTNAYAALWLDIVQRHAKRPGTFAQSARRVDMTAWPAPVVKLWRGEIAPDALLAAADNADATTKRAQVCEANFYGGEFALLKGAKDDATKLLTAAAKDCPEPFLERMAANAELKSLGVKAD